MSRQLLIAGSLLICIGIMLGAFAAHALENYVSENLLDSFEKGVRYQFYAGFALLITGIAADKFSFNLKWFFYLNAAGTILFSGCIYLYCFHEYIGALKPLVFLVPIGGISFITAWFVLIFQLIKTKF